MLIVAASIQIRGSVASKIDTEPEEGWRTGRSLPGTDQDGLSPGRTGRGELPRLAAQGGYCLNRRREQAVELVTMEAEPEITAWI